MTTLGDPVTAGGRSLRVAATACLSVSVMLAGGTQALAAKQSRVAPITFATAWALMPAADLMPVKMVGGPKFRQAGDAWVEPCLGSGRLVSLVGGTLVGQDYEARHAVPASAEPLHWTISATVFHDAAKAHTAMATLLKAEHKCPGHVVSDVRGSRSAGTRTVSADYAVGAWQGYRTTDHLAVRLMQGAPTIRDRIQFVYLTRDNVLLEIVERAPDVRNSGPRQDEWRRSVTRTVLASFDAKL